MTFPHSRSCHSVAPARGPAHPELWAEGTWEQVLALLPADLETTARTHRALTRRRAVSSAAGLLRLALAYSVSGWPLRLVAGWAGLTEQGALSDVALLYRLRGCRSWLGALVANLIGLNRAAGLGRHPRLRLVDATTVQRPGSAGADWRVHLSLELGPLGPAIDGLELTDGHGAEALTRLPPEPGDIAVADRGYARRTALGQALARGAALVVRIGWQNLPLRTEADAPLDLLSWLRTIRGPADRPVRIVTPSGRFPLRLVALPLPPEAAAAARRRVRRAASKKGRTPDQRSLEAAGYVVVVTTLPSEAWSPAEVLALYRIRWQVELAFKRLKSLWHLDHLRARDPDLAQTFLLATLLAALLAERLAGRAGPACADWLAAVDRPLSPWRWQLLWRAVLQQAVLGPVQLQAVLVALPTLRRHLCDPPRHRRQQAAVARQLVRVLAAAAPRQHRCA